MNTMHLTAIALVAFGLTTALPVRADDAGTHTLMWNCAQAGAPGLAQVKQLYGTSNNYQASVLRPRLHALLRAECQQGAVRVLVVRAEPVQDDVITVAQVTPGR